MARSRHNARLEIRHAYARRELACLAAGSVEGDARHAPHVDADRRQDQAETCAIAGLLSSCDTKRRVSMRTVAGMCAAALLAAPVLGADPPGFALWRATDLKSHDAALSKHVADDHSSRETLADYKSHRFRML